MPGCVLGLPQDEPQRRSLGPVHVVIVLASLAICRVPCCRDAKRPNSYGVSFKGFIVVWAVQSPQQLGGIRGIGSAEPSKWPRGCFTLLVVVAVSLATDLATST